jgi:hypothetical protein
MAAPASNGLALANSHLLIAWLQLSHGSYTKFWSLSQSRLCDDFDTYSVYTVFIHDVLHIWSKIEGFIQICIGIMKPGILIHCHSHMCNCSCHLSTFCSIMVPSNSYVDTNIGTGNLTHYFWIKILGKTSYSGCICCLSSILDWSHGLSGLELS